MLHEMLYWQISGFADSVALENNKTLLSDDSPAISKWTAPEVCTNMSMNYKINIEQNIFRLCQTETTLMLAQYGV